MRNYFTEGIKEKLNSEYIITDGENKFIVDYVSLGETAVWIHLECPDNPELDESCSVYITEESIIESLDSQGYTMTEK